MNPLVQSLVAGAIGTLVPLSATVVSGFIAFSPPYKDHSKSAFKTAAALCVLASAFLPSHFWLVGSLIGVATAYAICKLKLKFDPLANS